MDEKELRVLQKRGEQAKTALSFLEESFEHLEALCVQQFKETDRYDDIARRACKYYLDVLHDVRERITSHVRTGEIAERELLELKKPSRFNRRAVNG